MVVSLHIAILKNLVIIENVLALTKFLLSNNSNFTLNHFF